MLKRINGKKKNSTMIKIDRKLLAELRRLRLPIKRKRGYHNIESYAQVVKRLLKIYNLNRLGK